jgi:cell division protease FtsH
MIVSKQYVVRLKSLSFFKKKQIPRKMLLRPLTSSYIDVQNTSTIPLPIEHKPVEIEVRNIVTNSIIGHESTQAPDVKFSEMDIFKQQVDNGKVEYVLVSKDKNNLLWRTYDGKQGQLRLSQPFNVDMIDYLVNNDVMIRYETQKSLSEVLQVIGFVLNNSIYWVIGGIIIYSFWSQRTGGGPLGQMKGFTAAKPAVEAEQVKVRFEDVAGLENAKLEVMEIVDFLKNPEKYAKIGAKIPKGVLLSGGPGLGKTLLAKAVAGEAGVPFFAVPASSFIELFVGVGASRIRELFKQANSSAPCIIFIDEIDAIGRTRSSGGGGLGGNDEREQTINQLLTEMDGFNGNNGVVVMAATNRPDVLDPALVRPGRFDRTITLDPPTIKDREAILAIHTKNKPLDDTVDLQEIARNTVGLSGAELANISNEAAIVAARRNAEQVSMTDFMSAIDRVLLGPEKKSNLISEKKKRIVAAHEAGHTIVALKVGEYDKVSKVSIVPRGKSGGVTMFEPTPENAESGLYSQRFLENRLAVALGGRAAEEIVFGENDITTGAYSDMEVAQQIARAMITDYGFSQILGPISWANRNNMITSPYSNETMQDIDKEVIRLVKHAYTRAKNIINNNKQMFNEITESLYNKEMLSRSDIETIRNKYT